jgi:hypothetical protein
LKKYLFSTTALAVAGAFAFSGTANAAAKPISIGVGGFMNSEMGVGSNNSTFESAADGSLTKSDSFNTVQDSEIYFTGTTKLDSGISVSVTVQLEADQTGGIIDESYMKLTGGFGDLRLGYVTGAASTLKHTAPFVGVNLTFGGSELYVIAPTNVNTNNSTHVSTSGDAAKISYISPRVGGLAFGVAITPDTTVSNAAPLIGGLGATATQVYEAALTFEQTVGTTSVKADIEYEHASGSALNTHDMLRGGLVISAGGFTVGGSMSSKRNSDGTKDNTTNTDEIVAYDIGVSYAMGDYTFGIAGATGEADTAEGATDTESKWSVGASYGGLGGGVTLTATYINADYDDSGSAAADNNDGHAMIGQIKVAF